MVERKAVRRREPVSGHDSVFPVLAVQFVCRTNLADRVDHRNLYRGAVDGRARGVRSLGGVAQPDRRAVAHRIALAAGFPRQRRDDGPRGDRQQRGGIGSIRDVARPQPRAAPHGSLKGSQAMATKPSATAEAARGVLQPLKIRLPAQQLGSLGEVRRHPPGVFLLEPLGLLLRMI